jgi:hypothetical protein
LVEATSTTASAFTNKSVDCSHKAVFLNFVQFKPIFK